MKWTILDLSQDQINALAERYGIPQVFAHVFLRRGITKAEDVRFYLDTSIRSSHNPFLFAEMENVVERLNDACLEKEKVLVFGDRDVDGITSTALLVRKLRALGADVSFQLPLNDAPYGLTEDTVQAAAAQDITLIVTVDCGITGLDEIDAARTFGIDVIVIDHHNPQDELPDAVGIINPKLEDSGYPFSGLCAAALVSKVNWALDFSRTDLYGQEQCLINIRPGNDSLVFEAVKLRNMLETARLMETIVPGNEAVLANRVMPFIQGQALYVFDQKAQIELLKKLFGQQTEIYVHDVAVEVAKVFPDLSGKSLLRMIPGSKAARFSSQTPGEIDIFKQLMIALLQHKLKDLYRAHETDLAFVAMSTIADMMPMIDENRVLVKRGYDSLLGTKGGGLHSLLVELSLIQPPLSMRDIGWKLTPVINSSGRLGRPDIALNLLLSDDPSESNRLVKELLTLNDERKKHGEQAWKRIGIQAKENFRVHAERFIMVKDDLIPRGITGILAGRLAREYSVPAAVLAQVGDSLIGSIRTARGMSVTSFLSQFTDLLVDWGGHDAAGGFNLRTDNFEEFKNRIFTAINGIELTEPEEAAHVVDLVVPPEMMSEELWKLEEAFQPFGQESPQLLYCCRGIQIKAVDLIGKEQKKHLKLLFDTGQRQWPAVFWDAVHRFQRDFDVRDRVDILFRLEKNNYGQTSNLQLNIIDIKRSSEDAIGE